MGIANIINTAGGGGGGGSEIITNLVNSVDGAGLRLANQGYISCADVSANRFGTNDFSVEFVLSQETNAINADIFISNLNGSNQAVDAAVIRWDVIQNDNIQLVFTNSGATETAYNFGYDPAPDLNEPTHYLVSADRSGNAVLYRNGAEIASVSIAASGSANVGNSGQPTVIGSPVNNFGVKGNVYRFRTYSKALSSDEAKNVFDRADVPTALVSNLLLDLDCAYANPTQSTVIQDRGPNNQDGTLNGTITQTNVIKQGNLTSLAVSSATARTPADGAIISDTLGVGVAPVNKLSVEGYNTTTTVGTDVDVHIEGGGAANRLTQLGFGYNAQNALWKPPVIIGSKTGSASGQTEADFFVATRSGTTGTDAPETRLTIDSTGAVTVGTGGTASANTALTIDGTNATNKGPRLAFGRNSTNVGLIGTESGLAGNNSDDLFIFAETGRAVKIATNGAVSPKLTIDSTGYTFFNCTSVPNAIVEGFAIYGSSSANVSSSGSSTSSYNHLVIFNGNGQVGSIVSSGSATAYNTSSDYRLKENLTPLTGALDRLDALPVYRFNFKADPDTTVDGFVAHEVQAHVPEAVTGEKDAMRTVVVQEAVEAVEAVAATYWEEGDELPEGVAVGDEKTAAVEAVEAVEEVTEEQIDPQGIDQSKLVPLLVAAVKELKAKVETLENA